MGLKLVTRCLLSGAVLFHGAAIVIAPQAESYLGERVGPWVAPYVNTLEFAANWNFFAPEPGAPIYLDWELLSAQGDQLGTGRWPDVGSPFFLRERQNRRIASVRFMYAAPGRAPAILGPYLCKAHPEADSVSLWKTSLSTPSISEVLSGARKIGDETGAQKDYLSREFCRRES